MLTKLIFIMETHSDLSKLWTHQLFYIADPQTHMLFRKQFTKVAGFEVKVILAYFEFTAIKLVKDNGIMSRATHLCILSKLIICICAFNLQGLVDALVLVVLSL